MSRKKILVIGDHPHLSTGYANIIKHIFYRLNNFDVRIIGKFNTANLSEPIQVYGTNRETFKAITNTVILRFKPDLVIVLGDFWDVIPLSTSPYRNTFKLMLYTAIDGTPLPKHLVLGSTGLIVLSQLLEDVDFIATYTKFGKDELRKVLITKKPIKEIPLGYDPDIFNPDKNNDVDLGQYSYIRDLKVFKTIDVSRNFIRKQIYRNFEVTSRIEHTHHIQFSPIWEADIGWYIPELIDRYNVEDRVTVFRDYNIAKNAKEPEFIATLYRNSNLFIHPASREGFCIPVLEAMASGLPVLVTGYGPMLDFVPYPEYQTIKVREYVPTTGTSIMDAIIDVNDFAAKINLIRSIDQKTYKAIIDKNLQVAAKFTWDNILSIWEQYLKSIKYSANTKMQEFIRM